jgi:CheY-like chemotaxis protein
MDCEMPIMDGYESSVKITQFLKTKDIPKIPIVALTGNVSNNDIQKCKDHLMDFHLSKPVTLNCLKIFRLKIILKNFPMKKKIILMKKKAIF